MPRILLVDDDDLLRGALHKTLVHAGYEVEDASDGASALKAYQRHLPPDLVLTDIIMPNGEGLETIMAIRKLDADVKIIAMSGGGVGRSDDYLSLAKKLGATTILAKPFTGPDVLAAIAAVLAGSDGRNAS